jgi:type I restriction enzyme S subunit
MGETVPLEYLCERVVDCEHKTAPAAPPGEAFGYAVGTPHIRKGRILLEDAKPVTRSTYEIWSAREVPRSDDLILAREAPVGEVGRIALGQRICLGQRTVLLRPDTRRVDPAYLHYLLLSPQLQDLMHSKASGSTVAHLNVKDIRKLPIPALPDLNNQRQIAGVIEALDDKIAANDRIAATYEDVLRAKFAALGMTEEGDCAITELIDFNPRTPRPTQDEAVYADMAALPTRQSSIRTWAHRTPKGGSRFQNGDTLLARITPCLENGKTGYVDFLKEDEVGTGSTEFIVMRSRKGVPPAFSYFLARDARFREHAIRKMVGSSGRQRVSAADAAQFFVRRPDSGQLSTFGSEAGVAFGHLKCLMEESRVLERLRDTLLPELMSGRLRVKETEKVVEEAL